MMGSVYKNCPLSGKERRSDCAWSASSGCSVQRIAEAMETMVSALDSTEASVKALENEIYKLRMEK